MCLTALEKSRGGLEAYLDAVRRDSLTGGQILQSFARAESIQEIERVCLHGYLLPCMCGQV